MNASETMDALILAGGKSRRMGGLHKGKLELDGESFTRRLIRELHGHAETIHLSYGAVIQQEGSGCHIVQDEYVDCGPLGGLHAGLKACTASLLLVAACDMPLLTWGFYRDLQQQLGEADGVIPVLDGQIQPLAAIYRKELLPQLEQALQQGQYRLRSALDGANIRYVDGANWAEQLQNINTQEEYAALLRSREASNGTK